MTNRNGPRPRAQCIGASSESILSPSGRSNSQLTSQMREKFVMTRCVSVTIRMWRVARQPDAVSTLSGRMYSLTCHLA